MQLVRLWVFHNFILYCQFWIKMNKNIWLPDTTSCTCTHAINGGKQRVLLLRNAFMLARSSSLIFPLSALDLSFSISWRIPANRELKNCLAKMGSFWRREIIVIKPLCFVWVGVASVTTLRRGHRVVAVLPEPMPEGGWWGYYMRSGCLESLPFCNYDRESPEPLCAAFGQLFLPVRHPTKPLAVRDWQLGVVTDR